MTDSDLSGRRTLDLGPNSRDFQAAERRYGEKRRAFQAVEHQERGMGSGRDMAGGTGRPVGQNEAGKGRGLVWGPPMS